MDILNKYRIYCQTEQKNVYSDFREVPLDCCPNNINHSIDIDSLVVTESMDISNQRVVIQYDSSENLNNFRCAIDKYTINDIIGWSEFQISWPMPITLLEAHFDFDPNHDFDDKMEVFAEIGEQNIYLVDESYIGRYNFVCIGRSRIGGTYIPANSIITMNYYNSTPVEQVIYIRYEFLY